MNIVRSTLIGLPGLLVDDTTPCDIIRRDTSSREQVMTTALRWTSADLEALPDNGKRYEIIDGELLVSKQPHYYHQLVCFRVAHLLELWNKNSGSGQVNLAPGVIFADDAKAFGDLSRFVGKTVTLSGKITSYQGKTEIVLSSLSQLTAP